MKTRIAAVAKITEVSCLVRAVWLGRRADLKIILTRNFLKIQIFVGIIVLGLLVKEVFRSGFGFDVSINSFFTFLWVVAVYLFKMPGVVSIFLSLLFIFAVPFFMVFGALLIADQGSIMAYLFLVLGILQIWREKYLAKDSKVD